MSRCVRVATIALNYVGGPTVDHNRAAIGELIAQAAAERPDIICLPETFVEQGVAYKDLADIAETVPGPTTDCVAALARKHGCYIICPLTARHADRYMNDAVLIDRQGQIVGAYSKIHPVVEGSAFTSLEKGITPGEDAKVFETDWGRLGIQICFDINWPEPWAQLKAAGADIIFWCSAYDGGVHLNHHAWNQHCYVVSAVKSTHARIVNPMGETLAMTGRNDRVVARTLNLDVGLFHTDFNGSQVALIRARYGPDVTLRIYHQEAMFTLESNRPDLSVSQIVDEFALDPLEDYIARNTRLQDAWREGRPAPDLAPPYLGRKQWA